MNKRKSDMMNIKSALSIVNVHNSNGYNKINSTLKRHQVEFRILQ